MSVDNFIQIAPVLAVLVGMWLNFRARKKTDADAASVLTDAAVALVAPLRQKIADNEIEIRELKQSLQNLVRRQAVLENFWKDYEELHSGAELLYSQIIVLGDIPVYTPPPKRSRVDKK